jgi:hypothetical protein
MPPSGRKPAVLKQTDLRDSSEVRLSRRHIVSVARLARAMVELPRFTHGSGASPNASALLPSDGGPCGTNQLQTKRLSIPDSK